MENRFHFSKKKHVSFQPLFLDAAAEKTVKIAQLIRYSDQTWFLIDCQQRCQTSKRQVGKKSPVQLIESYH